MSEYDYEYEYDLQCQVCEEFVTLVVRSEEIPTHCPMCGSPCEVGDWG